jgi:hypothetical protein
MRNLLLLLFTVFFILTAVNGQSYKSSYTFQKNTYTVAALQVPFEEDVVADAVKDYMLAHGYKDAHYKDFIVFRSVPLDNSGSIVTDTYFNINRKSRSEKDMTIVSLLPVKKGETLSPATVEDSSFISNSIIYLDSLKNRVYRYSLTKLIEGQQKTLDKTQAKLLSLKNDSGDIAKKIRNYESELVDNKNDQEKQTKVINNISTGDQEGLSKAHKKMDKLLDNQTDYEKKLRNYKADLEDNTKERAAQQEIFEKVTLALNSLKQRQYKLGTVTP